MIGRTPQWLPLSPRVASQPVPARASSSFSSAPQVIARATSSGAGLVRLAIVRAIATSATVGLTVTGKRPERFERNKGATIDIGTTEGFVCFNAPSNTEVH